jgi:hypothetical protein
MRAPAVGLPPTIRVHAETWTASMQARRVGPSLDGFDQLVGTPGARWKASMELGCGRFQLTDWRAFLARHRGGMVPALLGPRDGHFPAWGSPSDGMGGFSDATGWSDGTGWDESGGPVVTNGAWPAGSRRIRLSGSNLAALVHVGQFVSFQARLFVLNEVTPDGVNGVDIRVWPPLPANLANNVQPDLQPMARMRLVDPDGGAVGPMATATYQRWSVEMIEVPPEGSLATVIPSMPAVWT